MTMEKNISSPKIEGLEKYGKSLDELCQKYEVRMEAVTGSRNGIIHYNRAGCVKE